MLRRKICDDLMEWKSRLDHKCLVVGGQRQVGKTFIVSRFGEKNYGQMLYVDLSKDHRARRVFAIETTVDGIVAGLCVLQDMEVGDPEDMLIFLDEIQASPHARSSLKLFTIDGRYDVIASGSLLGVRNPSRCGRKVSVMHGEEHPGSGFFEVSDPEEDALVMPAGYEESITMRSLDFEEFLWAMGVPQSTIDTARACIHSRTPMPDAVMARMEACFRDYMIVGGMPKAVSAFASTRDYAAAGKEILDTIGTCLNDIDEYNLPVDGRKVRECFHSIPDQLSRSNKKFMFSRVPADGSKGTREKYDGSIEWVYEAGYAVRCHNIGNLAHPVSAFIDHSSYRVYMSDTGILLSLMGTNAIRAVYEGDYSYNMGATVENAVAEGICKCGLPVLHYERTGEDRIDVDFVLEFGRDILAIEVKSGKDRRSPSLSKVREKYRQANRRIKLERTNIFTDDDGVEHYPLFAACFADMLAPDYDGPEFVAYGPRRSDPASAHARAPGPYPRANDSGNP
ncbi:MAG: AAA family ATPase [Thermoplasmata archaeon]|nr:AAA family ATPase [Thermoplasmata archaeon]